MKKRILSILLAGILLVSAMMVPVAAAGNGQWVQDGDDWYYYENGDYATGWIHDGYNWYYMDVNGVMQTGWLYDSGCWYYLLDYGAMATGWVHDGYNWYYMNGSGVMQTGWLKDGGWYYLHDYGAMATGWVHDGANWYYMNGSGVMQTGWLEDGGCWYYLLDYGAMATGWVHDGYNWYYMSGSGAMQTGWLEDGGSWYYLNSSGAMHTGWLQSGSDWYYLDTDGTMVTGKKTIDNVHYTFDDSGILIHQEVPDSEDQEHDENSTYLPSPDAFFDYKLARLEDKDSDEGYHFISFRADIDNGVPAAEEYLSLLFEERFHLSMVQYDTYTILYLVGNEYDFDYTGNGTVYEITKDDGERVGDLLLNIQINNDAGTVLMTMYYHEDSFTFIDTGDRTSYIPIDLSGKQPVSTPDDDSGTNFVPDCVFCNGSGRCDTCDGYGKVYSYVTGGRDLNCKDCNTSGRCKYCHGTGKRY